MDCAKGIVGGDSCPLDTKESDMGDNPSRVAGMNQKLSKAQPVPDYIDRKEYHQRFGGIGSSSKNQFPRQRRTRIDLGSVQRMQDIGSSLFEGSPMVSVTSEHNELSLPTQFGKKIKHVPAQSTKSSQSYSKHAIGTSEDLQKVEPFDICLSESIHAGVSKSSLNREDEMNQNDDECTANEARWQVLRPGMVLLKHYVDLSDQVQIVKMCRALGLGPGGFYRPGYHDGAKLRLQMMCLGLNWDPGTRKYEDQRPIDKCKPPGIPHEFNQLVKTAIQDAHELVRKDFGLNDIQDTLPGMTPNICIVNFYTTAGRLGLHQDRDESAESLRKGLPVVSVSIGDSAVFLYGNVRDPDKVEKIVIESGDVLIFGGKSRHIYHGVSTIIPNSAPRALLEESGLRPGRLNLTFRQY